MAKHFLYLTNDRLISLIHDRNRIAAKESFTPGDIYAERFTAQLKRYRTLPTHIITDLIEEDFRLETIPHLRGGDQAAVIDRKLGQLYRASTFRHAIVQGREEEGRRDDRVLFHAVTNPDLLKPLLGVLEKHEIPLEGIHSSAVLSGRLPKLLDIQFPHTLLVTIIPDFGLRQTYFQNKQIKFSRITPIITDEAESAGSLIAAETSRTWQYLDSLRYFSTGDTLEVCLLIHERDRAMVTEAVRSYPLLKYRFLDMAEVAQRVKLKAVPASSHAEEILVHSYAQGAIQNHFAEPAQRRFSAFRRARLALIGVTGGLLAAGAAGAAFNLYQASRITTEVDQREKITRGINSEYQSVVQAMQQQKIGSEAVRDSTAFFNTHIRPEPASPGLFLREISRVLSDSADVRLIQVVWTPSNDENTTPFFLPARSVGSLAIVSETPAAAVGGTSTPAVAPTDDRNPPFSTNKFQIGIIEAAITPFDGDFRKTLAAVERFNKAINDLPGIRSAILTMPLDVRPEASLRASKLEKNANEARFVLKVVRTVPKK